jgi:hypothetical protein
MAQDERDDIEDRVAAMNADLDEAIGAEPSAVAVRQQSAPVSQDEGPDMLIRLAVERGVNPDELEKLIALRNREIARQAKERYEVEFARLQSSFDEVKRTKQAKDGDRVLYSYAPLEDIVAVVGPTIADHGFSYKFEEERLETVDERRIWCIVRGYGHEERTYVDIPIPPATKFTNSVQTRGVASSYGKRYAFLAAFGITINDEDDDAQSYSLAEVQTLLPSLSKIETAATMDELKEVFKAAFAEATSEEQKMLVIASKNRRKEALRGSGE